MTDDMITTTVIAPEEVLKRLSRRQVLDKMVAEGVSRSSGGRIINLFRDVRDYSRTHTGPYVPYDDLIMSFHRELKMMMADDMPSKPDSAHEALELHLLDMERGEIGFRHTKWTDGELQRCAMTVAFRIEKVG